MFLGKFSCVKSCISTENTDCDDETSPQLQHISKITNAAPATSKWNTDSPDKISIDSQDSITIGTVGPIQGKQYSPDNIPENSSKHESRKPPITHADFETLNQEMKRMNKELQELIEKREEENTSIKNALGYFKNQAEGIRTSPRVVSITNAIQKRASVGVTHVTGYFQTIGKDDYKTLFWKIGATCLIMHLGVTDICSRFIPKLPWLFDFIFSVMVYSHLFLTSGMLWLNRNSQNVPSEIINSYQTFAQQIGAVLSGGALVFLKLRQCSEKRLSMTAQGQLALTISSYFIKMWTPEDLVHFSDKILLFLQISSIILKQI